MEVSQSDARARRICSLALAFMNASGPLTTTEVAREFYPGLGTESARRAFARDREALAACGIHLKETDLGPRESEWSADGGLSFATGPELAPDEAAALAVACRPLVADPAFPMADELRFALAKLGRAFAEPLGRAEADCGETTPALKTLRNALLAKHAVRVTYVDAAGRASERVLLPYGFFALRDVLYLVAVRDDDAGAAVDAPRTYRVDRVRAATELAGTSFEVPADFCVDDYRRLPFQLGEKTCDGVFEAADGSRQSHEVSSVADAASWAVAQGLTPLEPPELADAWRDLLEGVLANG